MKKLLAALLIVSGLAPAFSQPLRVAVLEFEDRTGMRADARLGGTINPAILAEKGLYSLGQELVGTGNFALIDRRDFINQIENARPKDGGQHADARPTFIHAAQNLRADAVLRGQLLSFSSGKQVVNQGGHQSEHTTLSLRIGLQALDAVDGTVIAMAEGSAEKRIRQTENLQTFLGEDQALDMLGEAVRKGSATLQKALNAYVARNRARPRVSISVASTADPALVEIDGVLVGTTPLENFQIYQGDHVLTVGKPGYRDVTKRILLEQDTKITVPMLRTELTADEVKDVLDKVRFNAYIGAEPALIIETIERVSP